MANFISTTRTNYFCVKNEDAFREFMNRVYGEFPIEIFEKQNAEGRKMFSFGSYAEIAGVKNAKDDETEDCDTSAYDEFIEGLQEHVAEGDAIIIMEAGNEALKHVCGVATIVTSTECKTLSLAYLATEKAKQMLGNPKWDTNL